MLILAFDTSGFSGSVALLDGPDLLAERPLPTERRSAQTLAPILADVLAERRISPADVGLVATTIGPGSFTGLRVGVTTAKTLAYAIGAEVIAISTLEAIASRTPAGVLGLQPRQVHAVLDAQRQELFLGRFHAEPGRTMTRLEADRIISISDWLASLSAGAIVTGPALRRIDDRLPAGVIALPLELHQVRAADVGRLAWRDYQAGRRDDLWKLAPLYLRPSYAEEKAGKKPTAQ